MSLTKEYFFARITKDEATGCWLWTGRRVGKYGVMTNGHRGNVRVHRFSYETFVGGPGALTGYHCCHKCDVPLCVNPDHLFKGTHTDNMRDASAKGRHWTQLARHAGRVSKVTRKATEAYARKYSKTPRPHAKLDASKIECARALRAGGATFTEIGKRLGVTRQAVALVLSGKTHRYLSRALAVEGG